MFPGSGLCDPHLRPVGDTAYLYLTRDKSPDNTAFIMEDWWVLKSRDLTHWEHACTIRPGGTYLGAGYNTCWAADVAHTETRSYFYFSDKNQATGVLVGESPVGPWTDPLGKPLITFSDLPGADAQTRPYDPGVFIEDNGTRYLVVGVWEFFLVRLNADGISFDAPPRKLEILDPVGPYGLGKTDDKPFLFKRNGLYYLSWGAFYAISESLHGPYQSYGAFITESATDPELRYTHDPHLHDRHGSFFNWQGRWYFIGNDMSQTRSRKFRDCSLAPVCFRADGTLEPLALTVSGIWGGA